MEKTPANPLLGTDVLTAVCKVLLDFGRAANFDCYHAAAEWLNSTHKAPDRLITRDDVKAAILSAIVPQHAPREVGSDVPVIYLAPEYEDLRAQLISAHPNDLTIRELVKFADAFLAGYQNSFNDRWLLTLKNEEWHRLINEQKAVLDELESVKQNSEGVAGYHKNGAVATWQEVGLG